MISDLEDVLCTARAIDPETRYSVFSPCILEIVGSYSLIEEIWASLDVKKRSNKSCAEIGDNSVMTHSSSGTSAGLFWPVCVSPPVLITTSTETPGVTDSMYPGKAGPSPAAIPGTSIMLAKMMTVISILEFSLIFSFNSILLSSYNPVFSKAGD
ncbi:MAG TPA: hypothetical protein PLM96_09750 [Methanoregulaceae archaeon]|nr:hypothetical protein [Methanoregulaceae archaeon]